MRLNLGCGHDFKEGYVNCDNWSTNQPSGNLISQVKYVDLLQFPWPFEDNSVDEILMLQVLEHLPDTYAVMREVKRILKSGGFVHGKVPYALSYASFSNAQHYRYFLPPCFTMLGRDFDMDCEVKAIREPVKNWKWKLRNLIPARLMEVTIGWNAYDNIEFKLTKH
jgi:SAM-dependent methyltransferase